MTLEKHYLTISALTRMLNATLEEGFPKVLFTGEISELNKWSSGHLYFTLKDSESQVPSVMWRSSVSTLTFQPKVGDAVLCTGRPNLYTKNGRFQMIVTSMEVAGAGALQKKFLEMKAKLEKEGLFSADRKRSLPYLPKAIGVVTSGQGAVIHDIMIRIRERMPHLIVYLVDVKVQGAGSANEIADGIRLLNELNEVDVIIVARGGGSLEDLWSFNEEVVVRAIFASKIPVVSGVGHEVDVTLADLVADIRAPTPTAAAEIVVPKKADLLRLIGELERRLIDTERWLAPIGQQVDELESRLLRRMVGVFGEAKLQLESASAKLRSIRPETRLSIFKGKIDILQNQLLAAGLKKVSDASAVIARLYASLDRALPPHRLVVLTQKVDRNHERLLAAVQKRMQRSDYALTQLHGKLHILSPQRVLERGFSIVEREGKILRSAQSINIGDSLGITFADGKARVEVQEKGE